MTNPTNDTTLKNSQAYRLVEKLGGPARVAKMLGINRAAVYRWTWPIERGGQGGVIPSARLTQLCLASRLNGYILTAEDLDPRPTMEKK
jgi:hypothetical protein